MFVNLSSSHDFVWILTHVPCNKNRINVYSPLYKPYRPQLSSSNPFSHSYFHIYYSKLADDTQAPPDLEEEQSKRVVEALYDALNKRDVDEVHRLLAPDLDWWFHGPPNHQHLMRLLTGSAVLLLDDPFVFNPISIVALESMVLVEGYDKKRSVSWVHAWSVNGGKIITQVREYFNTSLTITRFGNANVSSSIQPLYCQNIWESKVTERKSVPGLILAL